MNSADVFAILVGPHLPQSLPTHPTPAQDSPVRLGDTRAPSPDQGTPSHNVLAGCVRPALGNRR
jgi:hypothetical protein